MDEKTFKHRTRRFALDVIRLVESLPRARGSEIMGRQLLRCGTSVGANHRAACRARSVADMAAKLAIVEEEADESIYWLDLLSDSKIVSEDRLRALRNEAGQLVAMTVASIKTLRNRKVGGSS